MGIDVAGLNILLRQIKKMGAFNNVLMIGRQNLHINKYDYIKIIKRYDLCFNEEIINSYGVYAEGLFKLLGANKVDSLDACDYEGSTIIQNMNYPIDKSKFRNIIEYDFVCDFGTVEHIYNVPQYVSNFVKLVKIGGWGLIVAPANNCCGHGFYQFSPEFFYRAFNNMQIIEVGIVELSLFKLNYYKVADPLIVKRRIQFINKYPAYIWVSFKKVKEINNEYPIQSDYEIVWQSSSYEINPKNINRLIKMSKKFIPFTIIWFIKRVILDNSKKKFNKKYFMKITPYK